ncbi:hypothetical protein FS749_004074, partial [Ceratobasidium sp. UAMH 11750]
MWHQEDHVHLRFLRPAPTTAPPECMMQSLFARSGRPLRVHFDTKNIPPEAIPHIASEIG